MKKSIVVIIMTIAICLNSNAQSKNGTRVGLTLSGGGAKGFAHVGILMAMDSAGLKVDRLNGTSCGAIIGSLYAAGYSGKQLNKIIREVNWADIFRNQPKLNEIQFREKEDYQKYLLQIPLEGTKLKSFTGFLRANGINRELHRLLFPLEGIKDFSKFDIPFECVAVDLATGQAVYFNKGEIVEAVRASMSIPAVFSAVNFKDTKLVDGGIVDNFPVNRHVEEGVDLIIGINVSRGLLDVETLKTPLDILAQTSLFASAKVLEEKKKLCDVFIEPDLERFAVNDFRLANEIIDAGIEAGKLYYPVFKKLADSLRGESVQPIPSRIGPEKCKKVDKIVVNNMGKVNKNIFLATLSLKEGGCYSAKQIQDAEDKLYSSLLYRLVKRKFEGDTIVYDVTTNPTSLLKLSAHYNGFNGLSLITGLTVKNSLSSWGESKLKLNLGKNLMARVTHEQSLVKTGKLGVGGKLEFRSTDWPFYFEGQRSINLNENRFTANAYIWSTPWKSFNAKLGYAYDRFAYAYQIDDPDLRNKKPAAQFQKRYIQLERNTLDHHAYPTRGGKFNLEIGRIFKRKENLAFQYIGQALSQVENESVSNSSLNYFTLKFDQNIRFFKKYTLFAGLNTGAIGPLNDAPAPYLYGFRVGGIQDFLPNQVLQPGVKENQIITNLYFQGSFGLQVKLLDKFRISLSRWETAYNIPENQNFQSEIKVGLLSGTLLKVGYLLQNGYVQASLGHSSGKALIPNIVFGYGF